MLGGTEGSLLHHLASDGNRPQANSDAPWDDPVCHTAPPGVLEILEHARLFSLGVQGAAFLYNLMIAERYEEAGHTRVENPVERYRDRLQEWIQECHSQGHALSVWDRRAFWRHIQAVNPAGAASHPRISHHCGSTGSAALRSTSSPMTRRCAS